MRFLSISTVVISVLLTTVAIGYAQDGEFYLPLMAPYRISGTTPEGFQDFYFFALDYKQGQRSLVADQNGEACIEGTLQLNDHTTYKFKSAKLIREKKGFMKLTFETEKLHGEYYWFVGRFLNPTKFENGEVTDLVGTLIKYKEEEMVAQAELGFYAWASE